MTAKEFNKQYHLQEMNSKWFQTEELKEKDDVQVVGKSSTITKDILKRFFTNKWNIIFLAIVFVIILLAIVVPLTSKYGQFSPISGKTTSTIALAQPTWLGTQHQTYMMSIQEWQTQSFPFKMTMSQVESHELISSTGQVKVVFKNTFVQGHNLLLGTDEIGRDVWTRLWFGTAWSLKLAILVAVIETFIGVVIGVWIGFHVGKATDTIVMRIIEIFKAVPILLWMILFATIVGTGFWSIALVLILVGWTGPIWAARMFTIKVKDQDFILAAEVTGVSKFGRIYKHILPNIMGKLLVSFVLRIPSVIFFEATLIFLGMTVGGENVATLGNLIQTGRGHILEQVYYALGPAMVILLLTVSLQIIANGLRDAFDPKISG